MIARNLTQKTNWAPVLVTEPAMPTSSSLDDLTGWEEFAGLSKPMFAGWEEFMGVGKQTHMPVPNLRQLPPKPTRRRRFSRYRNRAQRIAEYDLKNATLLAKESGFQKADKIAERYVGHRKGMFRRL